MIVKQGDENITIAENIADQAQQALQDAKRTLETDGRNALEKARERAKKSDQQSERMTEIAKQVISNTKSVTS